MEWNVYYHNFNRKKIETFNIFNHRTFSECVEKHLKECNDKEEFEKALNMELMYYFWSKAEWEIVLTSWTPYIKIDELDRLNAEREKKLKEYNKEPYCLDVYPTVGEKIDVYKQVIVNWDIFLDYVWSHKEK